MHIYACIYDIFSYICIYVYIFSIYNMYKYIAHIFTYIQICIYTIHLWIHTVLHMVSLMYYSIIVYPIVLLYTL